MLFVNTFIVVSFGVVVGVAAAVVNTNCDVIAAFPPFASYLSVLLLLGVVVILVLVVVLC